MAATEPGQVIEQVTKCFNSGDVEGLASLYEDGAAFIPEPGTVFLGCRRIAGGAPGLAGRRER
jgi:ketosteroid isomerase-like protein